MQVAIAAAKTEIIQEIINVLSTISSYEILWIARDEQEVVSRCLAQKPDILLLDVNFSAVNEIMSQSSCAILLLADDMQKQMPQIFEKMGKGAIDVISYQPSVNGQISKSNLLNKVQNISKMLGFKGDFPKTERKIVEPSTKTKKTVIPPLLLVGASTGGPAALVKLFKNLSGNNSFASVVIQHIDYQFAEGMAEWLQNQTQTPVKIIHSGMKPIPGTIFLAGQNDHVIINEQRELMYTANPLDHIYSPSIDVLFNSASRNWPEKGFAVLLTGMGEDGARGLKSLNDMGWHTLVEDQKSCVVYGMPKAAVEMGAASHIVEIDEIGSKLIELLEKTNKQQMVT
jgi:two-component system response regulator WspF